MNPRRAPILGASTEPDAAGLERQEMCAALAAGQAPRRPSPMRRDSVSFLVGEHLRFSPTGPLSDTCAVAFACVIALHA